MAEGPILGTGVLEFDILNHSTDHLLAVSPCSTLNLNLALLHSVTCKKMAELLLYVTLNSYRYVSFNSHDDLTVQRVSHEGTYGVERLGNMLQVSSLTPDPSVGFLHLSSLSAHGSVEGLVRIQLVLMFKRPGGPALVKWSWKFPLRLHFLVCLQRERCLFIFVMLPSWTEITVYV